MDRKKPCNCVRECPCYPNCDQMMEDGRFPGTDRPGLQQPPQNIPQMQWTETPDMNMRAMPSGDGRMTVEEENEQDWQKLKEMYPQTAKIILAEVERVCDGMEYEGSMMFDSMPDKVRIQKMTENIYNKVKDRYPAQQAADQDDMYVMDRDGHRHHPDGQNWLSDFIQVLLYQEMFQRRCRHRGCKRW